MVKAFMGMADFCKVGEDELYDVIGGCGTTYHWENGNTLTHNSDGTWTARNKDGEVIPMPKTGDADISVITDTALTITHSKC